nr:unnamed protein product [Naegleria fowleri]
MVLKAKFLSKEAQWMFRNGHERNFMMVSSCLLTQIKTTTTRGMEQFGKMKSIMMNNHQFRPLMTSLVSREVSKPTITEQQIQSAFEKKRLKHEQKQQEYETKMKNRSKERTREFVKWVGLFSILFFSITLYHINWLWAPEIEGALKDSLIYYFGDDEFITQMFLSVYDENKKMIHRTHLENIISTLRTTINVASTGTYIEEFGNLETTKCLLELLSTTHLTNRITNIYQQKANEEVENNLSKLAATTLTSFVKHFNQHPQMVDNLSYLILNHQEEKLGMFVTNGQAVVKRPFDILEVFLSNCEYSTSQLEGISTLQEMDRIEKDKPYIELLDAIFSNPTFLKYMEGSSSFTNQLHNKLTEWSNSSNASLPKQYIAHKISRHLHK